VSSTLGMGSERLCRHGSPGRSRYSPPDADPRRAARAEHRRPPRRPTPHCCTHEHILAGVFGQISVPECGEGRRSGSALWRLPLLSCGASLMSALFALVSDFHEHATNQPINRPTTTNQPTRNRQTDQQADRHKPTDQQADRHKPTDQQAGRPTHEHFTGRSRGAGASSLRPCFWLGLRC
jgi:hypothetical protein